MYDEGCDGQTFMPFHRASYDPNTGQSPNNPREQVRILRKQLAFLFFHMT